MSHQFPTSCKPAKKKVQNTSFFPSTAPVQVVARLLHLICFVRSVRETASTKYLLALSNLPPLCQPGTLSLLRPSPIVASSTLKICSVGKFFDASTLYTVHCAQGASPACSASRLLLSVPSHQSLPPLGLLLLINCIDVEGADESESALQPPTKVF